MMPPLYFREARCCWPMSDIASDADVCAVRPRCRCATMLYAAPLRGECNAPLFAHFAAPRLRAIAAITPIA